MKPIIMRIALFTVLLFTLIISSAYSATERRTALVIGNSAYSSGPLKNPVNDAIDMAAILKKLGFTVTLKKDADLQEMVESIEDFGNSLKHGGVGLFYYAGHGMQTNNINYLLPVKARINKESDVRFQAVDAGRILAEMENANNGLNIVILDACRDNPFGKSFRSASRGLAVIANAPTGTLISYSTGAGQVARDGDGRNSPYTEALLENIAKPGLTINDVFMNARTKVKRETGQVPWELSSLEGHFYFTPPGSRQNSQSDELAQQEAALEREIQELARHKEGLDRQKALAAEREQLAAERQKLEKERQALQREQARQDSQLIQEGEVSKDSRPQQTLRNYPNRPISLICPFNAGGGSDLTARAFASTAQKYLRQPVHVINKAGNSGSVAHNAFIKEIPDGYTLIITGNYPTTVLPNLERVNYHPVNDFAFLGRLTNIANVLSVKSDAPWNNFKQFLAYAKENHGKLKIGTSGVNSIEDLMLRMMNQELGLDLVGIGFDASTKGNLAVVGGQIHGYLSAAVSVLPHIASGRLKALVGTSDARTPLLTHVPTLIELGHNLSLNNSIGIAAPKGTPKDIVALLEKAIKDTYDDPGYRAIAGKLGLAPDYLNGTDFKKVTAAEVAKVKKIVGEK